MTDSRPRPQYGEYATPEEQARAMGTHRSAPAVQAAAPSGPSLAQASAARDVHPSTAQQVRSSRDLVMTVTLLAIGLVWVLLSIPGAANLPDTLNRTYELQGYTGGYGPVALASMLGLLMNISSIVVWGISCAVSVTLLRRHRRAAYVPIIGAVVAGAIALALTLVAMLSDPGLVAYINTLQA
ncbi:DUF6264 family protein [Parafrigoribacterium soli]|uniref:DUF6264 family protein n=1 Tax=Parafrigoribacterium soli TaxID=3144663 RepID=UPI0032EF8A32